MPDPVEYRSHQVFASTIIKEIPDLSHSKMPALVVKLVTRVSYQVVNGLPDRNQFLDEKINLISEAFSTNRIPFDLALMVVTQIEVSQTRYGSLLR